jgi:apolipoprotein N-acyltransferase
MQAAVTGNDDKARDMLTTYDELCELAKWRRPPDLMVWPETATPYHWVKLPPDLNQVAQVHLDTSNSNWQAMRTRAWKVQASQLLGTECEVIDEHGNVSNHYNSAVLIPLGNDPADQYDKIHPVPFGEYLPLRDWLPFMKYFSPYGPDWNGVGSGERLTRFELGKYRFGVLICNEDADPVLGRAYGSEGNDGPAVDFLINISNDGWFANSCEHEQHLAICRFRAIECRRAIARSVNTGISAIIDSNGRVQKPERLPQLRASDPEFWEIEPKDGVVPDLPETDWPRYKNVEAVLRGTMPIDHRDSLYVRFGDCLPWCCCIGITLGFAWSVGGRNWSGKRESGV